MKTLRVLGIYAVAVLAVALHQSTEDEPFLEDNVSGGLADLTPGKRASAVAESILSREQS